MKKLLVISLSLSLLMVFILVWSSFKQEDAHTIEEQLSVEEVVKETYIDGGYQEVEDKNLTLEVIKEHEVKEFEPEVELDTESKQDITQMYFWVVFYDQYDNELQREALKYGTVPEYKSGLPEGFDKWVYKNSGEDVNTFNAITGNEYFKAVCHSSGGGSESNPTPPLSVCPYANGGDLYYIVKASGGDAYKTYHYKYEENKFEYQGKEDVQESSGSFQEGDWIHRNETSGEFHKCNYNGDGGELPAVPDGFVDLGIKNSKGYPLYWAKCNLGADSAEEPGDYYMWGARTCAYSNVDYSNEDNAFTFIKLNPYTGINTSWDPSKGFSWENVPHTNGIYNSLNPEKVFIKYTSKDDYAKSGNADGKVTLEKEDDAANVTNPNWHIPTEDEFKKLAANCVFVWTDDYKNTGKAGFIVYKAKYDDKGMAFTNGVWKQFNKISYQTGDFAITGSYSISDIHIFFPTAGYGDSLKLNNYNEIGCYFSSSLNLAGNYLAYCMVIKNDKYGPTISASRSRYYGQSIRPVTD